MCRWSDMRLQRRWICAQRRLIHEVRAFFSDFPYVASRLPYCSYCLRARSLGKSTEKCSRNRLLFQTDAIKNRVSKRVNPEIFHILPDRLKFNRAEKRRKWLLALKNTLRFPVELSTLFDIGDAHCLLNQLFKGRITPF